MAYVSLQYNYTNGKYAVDLLQLKRSATVAVL